MRKRNGVTRICPICKESFYVYPSLIKERVYCSHKCKGIGMSQTPNLNINLKKGKYKTCGFCGEPYYCHKYRLKKSLFCSQRCLGKARKGKDAAHWKGGITTENLLIRASEEYAEWRKKVFERDNYTCQYEGCIQKGGILHAHHIKPFAEFPLLRFDVSNGVTLCEKHHSKVDKYFTR
jgi:hypothetical protein